MMKFQMIATFLIIFSLTSCFKAEDTERTLSSIDKLKDGGNSINGDGDGATNGDNGVAGDGETVIAKVEIRHLIEPKVDDNDAGDYKRKLTLPKNYNGLLYVAGINISSLSSKSIRVRFNFGLDSSPIEIPATISTAAGMTPQTGVEVLVMDLRGKPFEDIQLLYDLFDYNNYDFTSAGTDPAALNEPVSFNRDDKLFCRGLSLADDSTFTGSLVNGCSGGTDVCKYAYAKVVDKGLIEKSVTTLPDQPLVPSELQVQSGNQNLYDDTTALKLSRCLVDNPLLSLPTFSHRFDLTTSFLTFGSTEDIEGTDYIYQGPYRAINSENWQISSEAVKGQYGLFQGVFDDNTNALVDDDELDFGYRSKLFPLYTKFDLLSGTEYLGSSLPEDEKVLFTMNSNGASEWMDGCNERATTVHQITGEHIGSCNVTATIEIVATDDDAQVETVVDITNEVKLQLVKPSVINAGGANVLLSSFRQCSSSNQCGSDECCINKHCWSKALAGQCIEDLPSYGNQITGDLCTSDYQCASLCCNKIDGRCAPHDTISDNPAFCSKPSGQSCVAKEWCQKHPVTTCAVVNTGTDNVGGVTCALRCVTAEVYGDCISSDALSQGTCVPPTQPDSPVFNPNDPNRCAGAITFNQLVECANNPDQACNVQ